MTGKNFSRLSGTREGCGDSAIGDNTLADAILDRIVHNSHRFELGGESMRELMAEVENLPRGGKKPQVIYRERKTDFLLVV